MKMKKINIKWLMLTSLLGGINSYSSDFITNDTNSTDLNISQLKKSILSEEFPNFFSCLNVLEAKELLKDSVQSILSRSQIPHIWQNTLSTEDFFNKINQITKKHSSETTVYISGGVVRSLLGYIYQKLYKTYLEDKNSLKIKNYDEIWVRQTFLEKIIQSQKHLSLLNVFGIGSDFDLLIDSSDSEENQQVIQNQLKDFINSAETFFGLKDNMFELKKSIVPIADVKKYESQLGSTPSYHNAVYQGGSTLDWLSFSINQKGNFRCPIDHPYILDDFIKGQYAYLPHPTDIFFSDKQTIRGLRPLLEIPFLQLNFDSRLSLEQEIEKIQELSLPGQFQLSKLMRNARLEAGHNRFTRPFPFEEDGKLIETIKTTINAKKDIKEFLPYRSLSQEDKGHLKVNNYLEDTSDFFNKPLYHGTPNVDHSIFMMRGGFFISHEQQGAAVYGRGFYTFDNYDDTTHYRAQQGVTLDLSIRPYNDLRIADLTSIKGTLLKKHIAEKHRLEVNDNKGIIDILIKNYDIDLIKVGNNIVLVQNRAAIKFKKDLKLLYELFLTENLKKMKEIIDREDSVNFKSIIEFSKHVQEDHPLKTLRNILIYDNHDVVKNIDFENQELQSVFFQSVYNHIKSIIPEFNLEKFSYIFSAANYLGKRAWDEIYVDIPLLSVIHIINSIKVDKLKNVFPVLMGLTTKKSIDLDEVSNLTSVFQKIQDDALISIYHVINMLIEQEYHSTSEAIMEGWDVSPVSWDKLCSIAMTLNDIEISKIASICKGLTWLVSRNHLYDDTIEDMVEVLKNFDCERLNLTVDTLAELLELQGISFNTETGIKDLIKFLGNENTNIEKIKVFIQKLSLLFQNKTYFGNIFEKLQKFSNTDTEAEEIKIVQEVIDQSFDLSRLSFSINDFFNNNEMKELTGNIENFLINDNSDDETGDISL